MGKSDLRWFLYEDYVEGYKKQGSASGDQHMTEWLRKNVEIFSRHRTLYWLTDRLLNGLSTISSSIFGKGMKIMFVSLHPKHAAIIRQSSKDNQVFLLQNGIRVTALMTDPHIYNCQSHDIYYDLYTGIVGHDDRRLEQAVEGMRQLIGKYRPDVIVLNDDALPENRLVVLVARELGIPTVEIQHGIYQSNCIWPTGLHVDYVFVWGQYFADNYVRRGIRTADKIKVLGYPFELPPSGTGAKKERLLLVYFGGDFEKYVPGQLQTKLDTVRGLKAICESAGLAFAYRPHPGDDRENLSSLMPEVTFTSAGETLQESIDRGDIFVSFNSTALLEAALQEKLIVQLLSYKLPTDDFQLLGICPRAFTTLEEMEPYLKEIAKSGDTSRFRAPVKNSYIDMPKSGPGVRFLELVNEITAKL